jgi:hypothetical protein
MAMGTSYQYTCESCGYEAQVSGGRDIGMMAVVRTMFCRSCRELVDVLIGQQVISSRRKRTSILGVKYEEGSIYWEKEYRLSGEIPLPFVPPGFQIPKIKLGSILPNAGKKRAC